MVTASVVGEVSWGCTHVQGGTSVSVPPHFGFRSSWVPPHFVLGVTGWRGGWVVGEGGTTGKSCGTEGSYGGVTVEASSRSRSLSRASRTASRSFSVSSHLLGHLLPLASVTVYCRTAAISKWGISRLSGEQLIQGRPATTTRNTGDGTFPILFGYISYRIRIVLYLNVS